MKTVLFIMAVFGFIFNGFIINGFAAGAISPPVEKSCINIEQSLNMQMPELDILEALLTETCGMALDEAVDAIIAAGGNFQRTLAAALIINPDFTYTDPTAGLNATLAGPQQSINVKSVITTTTSPGGGASPS
ncbi:MAG: hypothetical protein COS35_11715 [Zetaproteobacteria bacterium CG02_land_8_20_14_3_00_50_9]|nr:MAG: hypothetical protein AUJ56_01170 [Zetaproteobacteria bacterium CG1_02_49_23]PIQ33840.1 MAG: hypothetical protein COW62_04165 [Zetaproteobacteria bacterium CG17_big_fil_post_rev_8_21_14_2_50_50_13]PIV29505.1 MAG: hypothetical protein COS35_11715 [Zetaproteobacteria bacterium CG02_land_8_20_14_3_00_50_9]PIY55568.1 MAG: hypothetical protein COZ00_08610 [Zetaproteobacteria bacterium CG_4_10_14_0_8_um_filter_49_80]